MASIFDGIDMADPCAVYPVLEAAYYRLLAGENVVRSKFGDEEMQFSIADAKILEKKNCGFKSTVPREEQRTDCPAARNPVRVEVTEEDG